MAEPTLKEIFGPGAAQTAATLTIQKADLPQLVASADNTAESLFAAILLLAKSTLTPGRQEANPEQSITIVDDALSPVSFVTRNNQRFVQNTQSVNFQEPANNTGINPNNY